ncbi:glutamate-gated chloride channel-like isoform X1 [Varroa destructor]|uniref:Neurotransmitter-gated ion-channel ligand-binding domain-containing protein n=1 Tax=Varroa destructor TaxID=109461 RepID=A0A7M7JLG6_VARDE|nr:glutamate-gated chloride channel-like isoform X1 [Varroa destructor]
MDSTKQSYSITHTHSVFPGTMILFIRLQLILRLRWRDERLIFNSSRLNYILVGRSRSERLWVPDMFITNEKEAQVHKTLSDNALIRIYPNGQVQHSVRISLSLSCPVNASWFPFGSVSCPLRVASYSRELTEMQLSWDDGGLAFYRGIELDGYRLENFSIRTEQCVTSIKLGKFSCVSSVIRLRRLPRRWLFTLFVPCVVLAGCAAITASFRRKNEHIVNALCFVAVIGITLQVSNAPSSDVIHAVDAWVLLVYGFFLFHIVLISYPKSKTNGCCSRRENSNQLPRTTRRFLEDNARIVFYGIFSAITLTYFIVVRLCTD